MLLSWLNFVVFPLLARIFLVCMFPFSGIDKIIHWNAALKQANSSFLPDGWLLLILGMCVEFITPVCIVGGWHDRLAAFVLAGYCALTAILFHPFWQFNDFWAPNFSVGRNHFWDFTKNFGLVGGLLLVIIGGDLISTATLLHHPLSSAPTTASPATVVQPQD
jgi:putative oxidoreductase